MPPHTHRSTTGAATTAVLRERILNAALLIAVIVGAVAFIRTLLDSIAVQAWVTAAVSSVLYSTFVLLWLGRRWPYRVRALSFLVVLFTMGVTALAAVGYLAGPSLVLVAYLVLASVLFGRRGALLGVASSLGAFVVVGVLLSTGVIHLETTALYDPTSFIHWSRVTIIFALFCGLAIVSVDYLTAQLEESLGDQVELVEHLRGALQLRDQAEAERRRAESHLLHTQKMEAIGRLAGGLAHDFNNTLTIIMSNAELLQDKDVPPDRYRQVASVIEETAYGASELTHQLLTFARKAPIYPKHLSANEATLSTANLLKHLLPEQIELEVEPLDRDAVVRVDRVALQQALLNLALNARDAMPSGGKLQLKLRVAEQEQDFEQPSLLIELTDTGLGMDAHTVAHAFEPFFTTKDPGQGTGLGLSTVDSFARASGGIARLESVVGVGTTVTIRIPLAEEGAQPEVPERVDKATPTTGTGTVLLVEDEPRIRVVMAEALRGSGYRVIEAGDGEAAVQLADTHANDIDLLCTDAMMPGLDGAALIAYVRANSPDTKFLLCSGYLAPDDLVPDIDAGRLSFLAKPFGTQALLGAVQQLLGTPEPNGEVASDPAG